MLATYESEQRELQARTDILEAELADLKEKVMNVSRFLKLVDEYTEITELTACGWRTVPLQSDAD